MEQFQNPKKNPQIRRTHHFIVSITTVIIDLAVAVLVGIIISALVFAWEQGKKIHAEKKTNDRNQKIYKLEILTTGQPNHQTQYLVMPPHE